MTIRLWRSFSLLRYRRITHWNIYQALSGEMVQLRDTLFTGTHVSWWITRSTRSSIVWCMHMRGLDGIPGWKEPHWKDAYVMGESFFPQLWLQRVPYLLYTRREWLTVTWDHKYWRWVSNQWTHPAVRVETRFTNQLALSVRCSVRTIYNSDHYFCVSESQRSSSEPPLVMPCVYQIAVPSTPGVHEVSFSGQQTTRSRVLFPVVQWFKWIH